MRERTRAGLREPIEVLGPPGRRVAERDDGSRRRHLPREVLRIAAVAVNRDDADHPVGRVLPLLVDGIVAVARPRPVVRAAVAGHGRDERTFHVEAEDSPPALGVLLHRRPDRPQAVERRVVRTGRNRRQKGVRPPVAQRLDDLEDALLRQRVVREGDADASVDLEVYPLRLEKIVSVCRLHAAYYSISALRNVAWPCASPSAEADGALE